MIKAIKCFQVIHFSGKTNRNSMFYKTKAKNRGILSKNICLMDEIENKNGNYFFGISTA